MFTPNSYAKKARITSADILADGLDKVYARLKTQIKTSSDLDSNIQVRFGRNVSVVFCS